ncbi:hypothetical protein CDL15_Pgr004387 [Punica granatum]|nr:hypothetical protein CDL15_Pgr004387 [Punica granatum]
MLEMSLIERPSWATKKHGRARLDFVSLLLQLRPELSEEDKGIEGSNEEAQRPWVVVEEGVATEEGRRTSGNCNERQGRARDLIRKSLR